LRIQSTFLSEIRVVEMKCFADVNFRRESFHLRIHFLNHKE